MNSKKKNSSGERIKKATEVIWKLWWFCFYLIIAPFITSLIVFYIFIFFIGDIYITLGFSVLIFMFSLLFFYKSYDRYKKKPFFKNAKNNLSARINILFLITIASLILTPIFILIIPKDYNFELFPLICYIVLYNIVWYYYYFQPIDAFHSAENKYSHSIDFKKTISKLHNLIVFFNYFVQILFLALVFYFKLSWLLLLITNSFFYLITIFLTRSQLKKIKKANAENRSFVHELTTFQKKFVISVTSLIFTILIQLPIIYLLLPPPGVDFTNLMIYFSISLIVVFIIFYFKSRSYIYLYYESKLEKIRISKDVDALKEATAKKELYQKFNSIFSGIIIAFFILFAFLIKIIIVILFILPFIYILSYLEQKAKYCSEKYTNIVYLFNTIAILAVVSFAILPSLIGPNLLNIQFIIFCISFYFILELFVKFKFFPKENVRILQNILAITSYFLIVYSLYPLFFLEYITFTSNPTIILLSAVLINTIIFLIVLLLSFYRFYPIFKRKSFKLFKISIRINIFLIILFTFILINIRTFFVIKFYLYINILIISTILIPLIFIAFLYINYKIGIFSRENFLLNTYYSSWLLISSIFLSIIFIFYNFITIILLDLLLFSILLHYQIKFGCKLKKIKDFVFEQFTKLNSIFFTVVLFCLNLSIFLIIFTFPLFWTNIILSSYISLIIICVLINILTEQIKIFSKSIAIKINIITLLYTSFLPLYFSLLLTWGTFFVLIVPIILTSIVLYVPIFYISQKELYPKFGRKLLILNSILLSNLSMLIPTIFALELARIGIYVDIILIILTTTLLLFGYLNFLDVSAEKFKIKENKRIKLNFIILIIWFSITFLIFLEFVQMCFIISLKSIIYIILSASALIFFVLNIYTLRIISKLKQKFDENKELLLKHLKIYTIGEYLRNFIFFGIVLSSSFLFLSLIQFSNLLSFESNIFLNLFWHICIFFSFLAVLLIIHEYVIKLKFSKFTQKLELFSWIVLKIFISLFFTIYVVPFSIFNKIFLFILILTLLTPLTIHFFKIAGLNLERSKFFIKKLLLFVFITSIIIFYIELFLFFTLNETIPLFYETPLILITVLFANLFLLSNFCLMVSRDMLEKKSEFKIYYFYGLTSILFFSILYINPIISIFLLILTYVLVLYYRNENLILRFILYFIISYLTFIEIFIILDTYKALSVFKVIPIGLFVVIYLASIIAVLFFSTLVNIYASNHIEKMLLYIILSFWSFVYILTFTKILLIYNITISLFIVLSLRGINLYRREDNRYKWFIKPCILLLIFDFTSWIAYSFIFINPKYLFINPILTFTLTASATSSGFVFLYNNATKKLRDRYFQIVLTSIIINFPTFIYFLLISYFPIHLEQPIALIITLNIGIFLFYISVGIYQWKISWDIWRAGWWAWILLPIINFLLIYNIVTGINVYANAINIFREYDMLIITLIICTLFELPVLYTWIKKHFYHILFVIWGETLYLVYFISLNLFSENALLKNLFFVLFSVILLIPILYKLKLWNIISKLWLLLAVINVSFLIFFLSSIGIKSFGILVSIGIITFGLFFLVYSFFPKIRSKALIFLASYFIILSGIFLFVFFLLFSIILNPFISINLAFIILAGSLFSSKYLKANQKIIHFLISVILIVNFSLLTYFTFSLIPGLELLSIFFAITVFGGSFFVFNHYEMFKPINKGIPWMIMGIGLSLSISSLFITFLNVSLLLISAIFSVIILMFLYYVLDYDDRYIMLFLVPIPLAFLTLAFLFIFEAIHSILILVWLILYLGYFQVIVNIFNYFLKDKESRKEKKRISKFFRNKDQIKAINLTCLIINSTYLSMLIAIIYYLSLFYQILLFLIIWPILMLFSLKIVHLSKMDAKFSKLKIFLNFIGIVMYILIPVGITTNIFLSLIIIEIEMIYLIFLVLIIFNGILFVEVYIVDRIIFKYVQKNIKVHLIFWSWLTFCNAFCVYFYFFHSNIFLLILTISLVNIISNYLLKQIPIKKKEGLSKIRIILSYIAFTTLAFYIASEISAVVLLYYTELIGMPSTILFFLNSVLILFILSYFLNKKIKEDLKIKIEFVLFLVIQGLFLATYWIFVFIIFKFLNIFTISLIVVIETCLSFVTVKYIDQILLKGKRPNFIPKVFSFLTLLLYFEISILTYGIFTELLGFLGAFLISQIVLFILTITDITLLKQLNKTLSYLIHFISYFIITVIVFFILYETSLRYNLDLIVFILFLFISMQFYSNHSFFTFWTNLIPDKYESFKNAENKVKCIIGAIFYFFLVFFVQRIIVLTQLEFQILILSLLVHGLMYIDKIYFKFLGKLSNYVKIFSWLVVMLFSSIYLFWIFNFYLYTILVTVIPLIVLFFVIEFYYLIKLLDFIQKIQSKKETIRKILITIIYVNFITWPLYFSKLNLFLVLDLSLLSIVILFSLTFIDGYLKVLKEKIRLNLRKFSFLCIGILVSLDVFIYLDLIVQPFLLNLSIAILVFLIFAAFIVKPFKKHSLLAMAYWNISFLFLSIITYFIFLSFQISLFFFLITLMIYWFVFALERLREIFSKLIDILTIILKKIKSFVLIAINGIVNFFKKYFKIIWIAISIIISITFAILISPYLGIMHLIPVTLAVFGLLYSVLPSEEISDPDKKFSRRMKRLIIIWGSVIGIIFLFIPLNFLILMIFIAILILGAILLPYIYFKEKRENISIKWRFYTTLFFIFILIITVILMYLQFIGILTI